MASGSHFPGGISTRFTSAANSAAGTGDLECVDIFCSGTASAAEMAVSGDITGIGVKQFTHIVLDGSGAITSNVRFPYDVTITDVIFGCTSVGSSASGLSGTLGSSAALFTSTTAFVFASASGFQHVFTVSGNSVVTSGATSTGYIQFVKAAGAATAIDYYVSVGYHRTPA